MELGGAKKQNNKREERCSGNDRGEGDVRPSRPAQQNFAIALAFGLDENESQAVPQNGAAGAAYEGFPTAEPGHLNRNQIVALEMRADAGGFMIGPIH